MLFQVTQLTLVDLVTLVILMMITTLQELTRQQLAMAVMIQSVSFWKMNHTMIAR